MIWHLFLKPIVMPIIDWWRHRRAEKKWWDDYKAGRL